MEWQRLRSWGRRRRLIGKWDSGGTARITIVVIVAVDILTTIVVPALMSDHLPRAFSFRV